MWFPGSNLPKRTGLYKRAGVYQARTRPRGALCCFMIDGTSNFQPRELYSGRRATTVAGSSAFSASPLGSGHSSSSTYFALPVPQPGSQCSVEAVITMDGIAHHGSIVTINEGATSSGSYDRQLYLNSSSQPIFHIFDGNTKRATGVALVAGRSYHLVGVASGSTVKLYVDGQLQGTTATANGGFTSYTAPHFMVHPGHVNVDSTSPFVGHILFAQYANVAWSDAEVRARAEAPYGHAYNAEDYLRSLLSTGQAPAAPPPSTLAQSAVTMITG